LPADPAPTLGVGRRLEFEGEVMKVYLISLAVGMLVGVIYALLQVRSPAPPAIALIGLLGMLVGERVVPTVKRMVAGDPVTVSRLRSECVGKIAGVEPPGRTAMPGMQQPDCHEPPLALRGAADHWNHRIDDDYSQPGALFRLMTPAQQQVLFDNTARAMRGVSEELRARLLDNCAKADPAYGAGVAAALDRIGAG
jgi:XapX domain-containing protein